MNEIRLTDAQLEAGLRRFLPSAAQAGLQARILDEVDATRQDRPLPTLLGRLTDADPVARRRAQLLVAAVLVAIGLAAAGVVGALLKDHPDPLHDLSLAPPADVPAFVRSTYELMPALQPVTVTLLEDGTTKSRIYVDGSGATRVDRFASPEATEPESYTIYSGTTMAESMVVGSKRVWHQQPNAISEDPRVFVFATLGAARGVPEPGCEVAISPGEVYVGAPARAWKYLGVEYVAGRPAHHFGCIDELWIDVQSRITLRSRAGSLDVHGNPKSGRFRTVEATQVVFGQPPAELFEIRQPSGVPVIDETDYQCARSPYCSASPEPVITPPPAPSDVKPATDPDELVAASLAATTGLPAYEVVVNEWYAKLPGGSTRVMHDGSDRYRVERTNDGSPDPPSITITGKDYSYSTELTTDGVVFWRDRYIGASTRRVSYPLRLPAECASGWQLVGTDLVQDRLADHLTCPGLNAPEEYWVDRLTHLVIRVQMPGDEQTGTQVEEVVDLRFGEVPADRFVLPKDADVR